MEEQLARILNELKENKQFRQIAKASERIDFCSNDYLGLAQSPEFSAAIREKAHQSFDLPAGSTGSRLISGNYDLYEETEAFIANFHQAEAGLIFNSGYDANLGLISTLPGRKDTILYDSLVHASIRDGIRLSLANAWSFAHNDPESLEKKLKQAKGNVFVVVESLYSMDGDQAPLNDLVALSQRYGFHLIVDEAHATGVFGQNGEGLVQQKGLAQDVMARVHTFGKALGSHGAIVLGSKTLRSYLVNFCRSFIYTTALPPHSVLAIRTAYEWLPEMDESRQSLFSLIKEADMPEQGPIQYFMVPGNQKVIQKAEGLQAKGYGVQPIRHPTVPKGKERIRICLHAFNTPEQVKGLQHLIDQDHPKAAKI